MNKISYVIIFPYLASYIHEFALGEASKSFCTFKIFNEF